MKQHGLNPVMIAQPIQQRCRELADQKRQQEQTLSGNRSDDTGGGGATTEGRTARELALQAAENRRARQQGEKKGDD